MLTSSLYWRVSHGGVCATSSFGTICEYSGKKAWISSSLRWGVHAGMCLEQAQQFSRGSQMHRFGISIFSSGLTRIWSIFSASVFAFGLFSSRKKFCATCRPSLYRFISSFLGSRERDPRLCWADTSVRSALCVSPTATMNRIPIRYF